MRVRVCEESMQGETTGDGTSSRFCLFWRFPKHRETEGELGIKW